MNIKQNHKPGHIYRTRTKRWGTSDLLCIKAPSNELMFLNLTYTDSAAYSFHACQAEEIIKEWTKLGEYIHFKEQEDKEKKDNEIHNSKNRGNGKPRKA